MATYTSSQVSSHRVRGNWRGGAFVVTGSIDLTTALAVGDVVELCQVPNGYEVVDVIVNAPKLDTGTTPTLVFEVGDSTTAGRYISGSTIGQTGGVARTSQPGGTAYTYTIGTNNGQTSGGNAGATVIQLQCTAAAATWANGTVTCSVILMEGYGAFS